MKHRYLQLAASSMNWIAGILCLIAVALWPFHQVHAQSNVVGTLLTSAARTVTTNSADIINTSYRGAHVIINVTVFTTGTWTPIIQGKDPQTGNYYTILTGPPIAATGTWILKVYPSRLDGYSVDPVLGDLTSGVNLYLVDDFLPRTWRISMVGASTPNATFSVSYLADF